MSNMLIRDKKLMGLSLVKDEYNNYIGYYNYTSNLLHKFENSVHNLYELMRNFNTYFPDWQDQGFGIYSYNKSKGMITLLIKNKAMHENNAKVVIYDNSMKLYPEIRELFVNHCLKRLDQTEYMHVQINNDNKEYHYSIDKYGNFLRICDIKGFLAKYPYFPNLSYVPKLFYRELHLVEESIARKHDVGLDFCLKLATDMEDNDILDFQDVFRQEFGCFVFDKTKKEHLQYLINYLKEKTPDNKHFNVINLLYSIHGYEYREMDSNPNSYCIKYTHGMKKELINLIMEDEDCISVINTNIIPRDGRNKMIRENEELIKELRYVYHDDLDIEYLKEYIDKDINNLKYVNIAALMKKDFEYACSILDKYILHNAKEEVDSIIDKILLKYSNCITETTIAKCIKEISLKNMHIIARIKNCTKYIPCIVNRLNGEVLNRNDVELRKNLNKMSELLTDEIEMKYSENGDTIVIKFIDKLTGEYISNMEEPKLVSKLVQPNKEEILDIYWEDNMFSDFSNVDETISDEFSKQLGIIFG